VLHEIELRVAGLRKEHLVGIGDDHLAAGRFDDGLRFRHQSHHYSSRAPSGSATRWPRMAATMRGTCTWQLSTITATLRGGVPATAVPAMKTPGTVVSIVCGSCTGWHCSPSNATPHISNRPGASRS